MPYRKLSRCHREIIGILYKLAENLKLSEIDYLVESIFDDIDIFLSGIYKVYVTGIKDGYKVKYVAVVKWHGDPQKRKYFRELYRREYLFYRQIMPNLIETQRRFGIIEGLKMKFYNCVYGCIDEGKETLVILTDNDFKPFDRFNEMDFLHASLVMKNLAKQHALSFVLEKTNVKLYQDIKKYCEDDVQYSEPDCVSKSLAGYFNVSVNVVYDPEIKKCLEPLASDVVRVLHKCTKIGPYSCICHADCWTNNIFFKYQSRRPVEVIFVDYQLCRIASPVTDISYFLYMSTDKDFLVHHYDRLLEIYYGTLSAVIRQCDLDIEDVYPKSVFKDHLRNYSVFGLIEALVSMKIITSAVEEAFEMTENYYTEDKLSETLTQNQNLFVKRVNGVVEDFFERGYSLDDVLKESTK